MATDRLPHFAVFLVPVVALVCFLCVAGGILCTGQALSSSLRAPGRVVGTPAEDTPEATKTDTKGCFEFNAVSPARYLLGIKKKDTRRSGESVYGSLYGGEAIVVFDLTAGQTLNAGRIFQKAR